MFLLIIVVIVLENSDIVSNKGVYVLDDRLMLGSYFVLFVLCWCVELVLDGVSVLMLWL